MSVLAFDASLFSFSIVLRCHYEHSKPQAVGFSPSSFGRIGSSWLSGAPVAPGLRVPLFFTFFSFFAGTGSG